MKHLAFKLSNATPSEVLIESPPEALQRRVNGQARRGVLIFDLHFLFCHPYIVRKIKRNPIQYFIAGVIVITLPLVYFYWQISNRTLRQNQLMSNKQVQIVISDQALTQETVNWSTFTNSAFNYNFKYPADLLIPYSQCGGEGDSNSVPAEECNQVGISFKFEVDDAFKSMVSSIQLLVIDNPENLSLVEFVKKYISRVNSTIAEQTLKTISSSYLNKIGIVSVLPSDSYGVEGYGSIGGGDMDKVKVVFVALNNQKVLQIVYPILSCTLRNESEGVTKGLYKPVACYKNAYNDVLEKVVNTFTLVK